ncbi:MAG: hypothetical protein V2A54_03130 [Bacteroidota bacterium]
MKKLLQYLLFLLFSSQGHAQTCLPQGILFSNQAAIDSFQIHYPNCTNIEGDVTITGENITNLTGLNVLASIGGDFYIEDNAKLTSLEGLESLNFIGQDLGINRNVVLKSLSGLVVLSYIGQDLRIVDNTEKLLISAGFRIFGLKISA